jgi:hypothetical protein
MPYGFRKSRKPSFTFEKPFKGFRENALVLERRKENSETDTWQVMDCFSYRDLYKQVDYSSEP